MHSAGSQFDLADSVPGLTLAEPNRVAGHREQNASPGLTRQSSVRSKISGVFAISRWVLDHLSRETSSGRFIPEMDGLRSVAIGMVVLFHLNGYLNAKSLLSYSPQVHAGWLTQVAVVGFRGVELFFVISGFILALPFAAHHLGGAQPIRLRYYYLRRLTRLEPPYFVTVLALFLLAIWIQGKTAPDLYPHLVASLLYSHNLIYGVSSPVIGVAWSLEIEVQFYLLVPLMTLLFAIKGRRVRRFALIGLTVLIQSLQSLFLQHSPRGSLSILAYLQFFLMGFLLADIYLTDWKQAPKRHLCWDLAALVGWPILFLILHSAVLTHWVFPFTVLLLYCAAYLGPINHYLLTNRWITSMGGMCYSIYLIHYEVISLVGRFTRPVAISQPYWTYLMVQLALVWVSIIMICGSYFMLLEKPCMRRDWPQRVFSRIQGILSVRKAIVGSEASD
jgi:peptidoglycan/LPS O-acetylase OafA/YrhL